MAASRRYTLHDVANRSGVSYQTVSRVINNHPYVAEATRNRVLKAISDLGYRPNRAAQSLAGHHSFTLGMTAFGMDYYGPAQMVINIERAARDVGYDLIFTSVSDTTLESIRTAVDHVRRWEVDGLLMIAPTHEVTCEDLEALCGNTPVVQIGTRPGARAPSVVVDQALGSRLITEHLLALGHRQFCEISGPRQWFDAEARHQGWLATLREAAIAPGRALEGDWTARSGYALAQQLIAEGVPFTALVVGNDQMALGAIRALQEHGLRVPEDVSVVGFDDIPEAAFFSPPLTTIRQEFGMLGSKAVEYLLSLIADPDQPPEQRVTTPAFVPRQSAGPCRG